MCARRKTVKAKMNSLTQVTFRKKYYHDFMIFLREENAAASFTAIIGCDHFNLQKLEKNRSACMNFIAMSKDEKGDLLPKNQKMCFKHEKSTRKHSSSACILGMFAAELSTI